MVALRLIWHIWYCREAHSNKPPAMPWLMPVRLCSLAWLDGPHHSCTLGLAGGELYHWQVLDATLEVLVDLV